MTSIIFTDTIGVSEDYAPKPASKVIPEWYKNTESYITGDKKPTGNGMTTGTIKRCMPVFDVLISGYVLVTHTDLFISHKKLEYGDQEHLEKTGETRILSEEEIKAKKLPLTEHWFEWPSYDPIAFHPPKQALLHPIATGNSVPKWINPWGIKTPPGYSTLFIPPVHRSNSLVALPGVVDTDTYNVPVNIVFSIFDPNFEGLIPAGTPIVQVIPFKRDSWEMSLGKAEDVIAQENIVKKLRTRFFDSYKVQHRQPKEYR